MSPILGVGKTPSGPNHKIQCYIVVTTYRPYYSDGKFVMLLEYSSALKFIANRFGYLELREQIDSQVHCKTIE